uniref:discoidin domain-containing protein n=1 Tax=Massilia alkalitolerans TaxID=286638 RepID=UPI0028B1BF88
GRAHHRLSPGVPFDGLVLMPRQNHRDHEGDVRELSVQVSDDGQSWREVLRTELTSSFDPQALGFGQAVSARQLRLVPLSGFGADRASAFADVAVSYTGPALPALPGDVEYSRSRSASADVDEAGMDDRRPRRGSRP